MPRFFQSPRWRFLFTKNFMNGRKIAPRNFSTGLFFFSTQKTIKSGFFNANYKLLIMTLITSIYFVTAGHFYGDERKKNRP